MTVTTPPPTPQLQDKLFLALGQTLYLCQLLEDAVLEVHANAAELLTGSGDGQAFHQTLETLSKQTLGQLLGALRKKADIRQDIESTLNEGLEARNFIVHRFARHIADGDLADEQVVAAYQRTVYEKLALVFAANDVALKLLSSIGELNVVRSSALATELRAKAAALRGLAEAQSTSRH